MDLQHGLTFMRHARVNASTGKSQIMPLFLITLVPVLN